MHTTVINHSIESWVTFVTSCSIPHTTCSLFSQDWHFYPRSALRIASRFLISWIISTSAACSSRPGARIAWRPAEAAPIGVGWNSGNLDMTGWMTGGAAISMVLVAALLIERRFLVNPRRRAQQYARIMIRMPAPIETMMAAIGHRCSSLLTVTLFSTSDLAPLMLSSLDLHPRATPTSITYINLVNISCESDKSRCPVIPVL